MYLIVFFILGLIVGSFLNALIHRLHTKESIAKGRSKCPHCGHELQALDLIPVLSFILLSGRCRYCSKKISWQYPIVELAAAVSFLLLVQHFQFTIYNLQFWFDLVMICFFIIIAVYDLEHYLILDKVVLPAVVLAFLYEVFSSHLVAGIIGVLIVSGFFALQYFVSGGRWIGFGDVKLGIFLGLVFGVGQSVVLLFLSYFLGAIVGLTLIAFGYKRLGSRLPFGTILSICGIIMLIYGPDILSKYLKILGF